MYLCNLKANNSVKNLKFLQVTFFSYKMKMSVVIHKGKNINSYLTIIEKIA